MGKTREALAQLRSQAAFRIIVRTVRDEFGAAECDLFLERDGRTRLYTTTRASLTDEWRARLWVEPFNGTEPLSACLATKLSISAHSRAPADLTHLSPELAQMVAADWQHERMVATLRPDGDASCGLLAVRGPLHERPGQGGKRLRVSQHLTLGFGTPDQPQFLCAAGCRHAEAAERQSWLVDESQAPVGQPLQVLLRGAADDMTRDLHRRGAPVQAHRMQLSTAFEHVHAARERLAAFAKDGVRIVPGRWC